MALFELPPDMLKCMPDDFDPDIRYEDGMDGCVAVWRHRSDGMMVSLGYLASTDVLTEAKYRAALKQSVWQFLEMERLAREIPEIGVPLLRVWKDNNLGTS
jgi:hypothetical protein